jgi:hypothetical protein
MDESFGKAIRKKMVLGHATWPTSKAMLLPKKKKTL